MTFIGHFGYHSGRDLDKFDGIAHQQGRTGAPIVTQHAVGYLEAEVTDSMDAGTHTLFLGRVVDAASLEPGDPMTYAYYHHVKGGKSPKTAPTYIPER
jgi:flavin reductase (DIM6/NTAB) family NADH-FMN oxidoreductase RutF